MDPTSSITVTSLRKSRFKFLKDIEDGVVKSSFGTQASGERRNVLENLAGR